MLLHPTHDQELGKDTTLTTSIQYWTGCPTQWNRQEKKKKEKKDRYKECKGAVPGVNRGWRPQRGNSRKKKKECKGRSIKLSLFVEDIINLCRKSKGIDKKT